MMNGNGPKFEVETKEVFTDDELVAWETPMEREERRCC